MAPNLVSNRVMNLGAQLGPMSITKLSPNWACQMGPIYCPKFLLSGMLNATISEKNSFYDTFLKFCSYIRAHPTTLLLKILGDGCMHGPYVPPPQILGDRPPGPPRSPSLTHSRTR